MRRLSPGACALLAVAVLGACGGDDGPAEAVIDGGTADVALLGDVVVAARPGGTVVIRHGGRTTPDAEAPMTHALVAATAPALPPVFERGAGGITPNPAVWGPCRGGTVAEALGQCPVAPAGGPAAWDGRAYWSLGAMLPGEQRELPLSPDLDEGDHALTCALHPGLRVVVRVGAGAPGGPPPDAAAAVARAREQAGATAGADARTVVAGVTVDDPPAYVAGFVPAEVRVRVGDAVTWRADSRAPVDVVFGERPSLTHTAPADGIAAEVGSWDGRGSVHSGFLSADPSAQASAREWTLTFTRAGTYRYASRFSDGMSGTVVVEGTG